MSSESLVLRLVPGDSHLSDKVIAHELNKDQRTSVLKNPTSNMDLRGLNILVVDDCDENQFLFKHLLTRKGATVDLAGDGLEGFHRAIENNYDLVLMDIQMPVMSGYTALEKLKSVNYSKPVIALTAHKNETDAAQIVKAGFSFHVTKPFEINFLVSIIRELTASLDEDVGHDA